MRSQWCTDDVFGHILAVLTPANALAIEVSARYGLRIGDVLALKVADVAKGRFTIKEEKTGKPRRITLNDSFQAELLSHSGRVYVFEHRTDWKKHRSRQAVYKDIRRACRAFRVPEHITPHSARKIYAVAQYKRSGWDIKKVQRLLNHDDEAVTLIYALADNISSKGKVA